MIHEIKDIVIYYNQAKRSQAKLRKTAKKRRINNSKKFENK
jgi:hypothetical protein